LHNMNYEAPTSVEAAVAALAAADDEAHIFAGGTDLLVQLREEMIRPSLFVDIKRITETRTITVDDTRVRIGAAVTGAELSEHDGAKSLLPGVVEAVELIGSAQVQGRATVGGNLCNASPAADSVPALIAAGAVAQVAGPNGLRAVAVEDFLAGPSQTNLSGNEFVVSLDMPKPTTRSADAYLRFIPRTEMDIAVVGASAAVTVDADGTCTAARLALGAVAPTARLVPAAATAMIGKKIDDTVLANVAATARDACNPIDDKRGTIAFRIHVAGVLAIRAVKIAIERAEAE
jgi:CO/xanthine dehydrogenase FAD-binding subunit